MVHPKGHIMARIEDLFVRTAVVREGAMGDSQALERGAEIPEGTQERVPDVLCIFAGLHHPSGLCQQLLPTGERVPSAKLLLQQLCFVTAPLLLLLALGILGAGCSPCPVSTTGGVWGKCLSKGTVHLCHKHSTGMLAVSV